MTHRMTAAEFHRRLSTPVKRPVRQSGSKYNNERVRDGDLVFDSKAEHRRWLALSTYVRAGLISELRRQVRYVLIPPQKRPSGGSERACHYVADFVYLDGSGATVVEDVKGVDTPEWVIKRKLMLHVHGIEVRAVRG